jgi:ketosteroid isomerase-like protein
MEKAQIKAIIDKAYAARKAGDEEALVGLFRPDAVFRVAGAPETFPVAASARGEAEIRARVRKFVQTFQFLEMEPLDLIIDGDKAARRWRAKIRYVPSGEVREMEAGDVWTFKDGRVASLVQFVDTAMVAELVKGAERDLFREAAARTATAAAPPH